MTWRRALAGLLWSMTAVGSVALIAILLTDPIFRESASVSEDDAFTLLALPILAVGATVFASDRKSVV